MKLSLLLLFLIPFNTFAQNINGEKVELINAYFNDTIFEGMAVIEIPTVNKNELFSRTKYWIGDKFRSSDHVIDMEDKSSEVYAIILKPIFSKYFKAGISGYNLDVEYKLLFYIKDGKVKIQIKDFRTKQNTSQEYKEEFLSIENRKNTTWRDLPEKKWIEIRQFAKSYSIDLIKEFESAIKKPLDSSKDGF